MLVAALPRDPAEYRRTESVTIGPKPRTRKMIGMISGRGCAEGRSCSLFASHVLRSCIHGAARRPCRKCIAATGLRAGRQLTSCNVCCSDPGGGVHHLRGLPGGGLCGVPGVPHHRRLQRAQVFPKAACPAEGKRLSYMSTRASGIPAAMSLRVHVVPSTPSCMGAIGCVGGERGLLSAHGQNRGPRAPVPTDSVGQGHCLASPADREGGDRVRGHWALPAERPPRACGLGAPGVLLLRLAPHLAGRGSAADRGLRRRLPGNRPGGESPPLRCGLRQQISEPSLNRTLSQAAEVKRDKCKCMVEQLWTARLLS